MLLYCYLYLLLIMISIIFSPSKGSIIPWKKGKSKPWKDEEGTEPTSSRTTWYFDAASGTTTPPRRPVIASDQLILSTNHKNKNNDNLSPSLLHPHRCVEPRNLPEQFMDWFRESHSDPTMLQFMSDVTQHFSNSHMLAQLRAKEPKICEEDPALGSVDSVMERALCPWEWRVNRDENREPKLISEAQCQCRYARGLSSGARCVPIRREFPVLRRIYCDQQKGRFEYVRAFHTVTVGCHTIMTPSQNSPTLYEHFKAAGGIEGPGSSTLNLPS